MVLLFPNPNFIVIIILIMLRSEVVRIRSIRYVGKCIMIIMIMIIIIILQVVT